MEKTFFFLFALLAASLSPARDFDAVTPSGHTLHCDVVQGGAMIVGWERPQDNAGPVRLTVPPVVSAGGADLRVVAVGDSAFMLCDMLVSVELPSSLRSVGRCAFRSCIGLSSVAVPPGVESVGEDAFRYVPNVEYRGTAAGAPWGALCLNAFREGQYYYSDSTKTHIVSCDRDAADAAIPLTVVTIGDYAFYCCCGIASVRIDSTVSGIGSEAFGRCTGLVDAFYNSPQNGGANGLFFGCGSLERVTIGTAVSEIPARMCYGCTALRGIDIPDNVREVNYEAFARCTSLETATMGGGLSATGKSMFEGCTGLLYFTAAESLREVRSFTFNGCLSLRGVTLGDSLELVWGRAFDGCASLESIYLGKSLTMVGYQAFRDCRSLEEIVLPATVRTVNDQAFSGCTGLARIACMRETSPVMGRGVFDSVDTGIEVYVPCDSAESYQRDASWHRFDSILGTGYYMVVTANNPRWGRAVVNRQPGCGGSTAVIEAVPAEGCRFVKWSNGKTDNPCQVNYSGRGYAYRKAVFEPLVGVREPVSGPGAKVYASHGDIVVEGACGERVVVYDLGGRQVYASAGCTSCTIHLPPSIYLVRVGNRRADKVMLTGR